MKTIRRLYFYAVAFIGIEVVIWGTVGLLRFIFRTQDIIRGPSQLAQALALILVGLPIFLIHWLLAQKSALKDEDERSSTLRALFLYGILIATLIPAVQQLLALVNRAMLQAAHLSGGLAIVGGTQRWGDNLIAILANLAAMAYFYSILRADRRTPGDAERYNAKRFDASRFNEVRRLYRIVWVAYGLILTIFGVQQSLRYVLSLPSSVLGSIGRETALNAIALIVIGAPIWVFTWRSLQAALAEALPAAPLSAAMDEQASYLRLGFLYLLSMLGLIVTMVAAGQLLYQAILRLLGTAFIWSEVLKDIGGPVSIGIPMAVLWVYHRGWLAYQIAFEGDPDRRAGKWRMSIYLRALLGLAAVIAGLVSLITVIVPMMLGIPYLAPQGLRGPLAGSLAAMTTGVLVWLPAWREAQEQTFSEERAGENARRSLLCKIYLYLVIFASVIGLMVSAGFMIYALVNAGLGSAVSDLAKTVIQNIANLVIFALLLFYHLTRLRADGSARADALSARQARFRVLVLDCGDNFGPSIQAELLRRQLNFSVKVADANQPISETTANLVILPSNLMRSLTEPTRQWLNAYNGPLVVMGNAGDREIWAGDSGQAVEAARAIYEGHPQDSRRSQAKTSVWNYVAYVCAVLFGIQLLLMLLSMGVSMVVGR